MGTIIDIRDREQSRIKKRILSYMADPSLIARDGQKAHSIIIKGLKNAPVDERKRFFLVLSALAQDELSWIMLSIIQDNEADEELKDMAAMHLSVIGSFVSNQSLLIKRLNEIAYSDNKDAAERAILALGWEGNILGVPILIDFLHHHDPDLQTMAVISMCNLNDIRLFGILKDRLYAADLDQKRAILYNLWRFKGKEEEALTIYLEMLVDGDPVLRYDIIKALTELKIDSPRHIDIINKVMRTFLADPDADVRLCAVKGLLKRGEMTRDDALFVINDPSMEVKRIALSYLGKKKKANLF